MWFITTRFCDRNEDIRQSCDGRDHGIPDLGNGILLNVLKAVCKTGEGSNYYHHVR